MLPALADATSPALTPASSLLSALVAALALGFALLALRAAKRRANPALRWVGAAFLVFALKNVFSAYNVATHDVPHDAIEIVLSASDFVIMLLLFVPLLRRRRS